MARGLVEDLCFEVTKINPCHNPAGSSKGGQFCTISREGFRSDYRIEGKDRFAGAKVYESEKDVKAEADKYGSKLTSSEAKAIKDYSGPGSAVINKALRTDSVKPNDTYVGGTEDGKYRFKFDVEKSIKELDSAVVKGKLAQDTVMWRNLAFGNRNKKDFQNAFKTKGKVIEDKAFVSASLSFSMVAGVAQGLIGKDNVALRIKVSKGHPVSFAMSKSLVKIEQEMILPRNTKFRVLGETKISLGSYKNRYTVIDVEAILPGVKKRADLFLEF